MMSRCHPTDLGLSSLRGCQARDTSARAIRAYDHRYTVNTPTIERVRLEFNRAEATGHPTQMVGAEGNSIVEPMSRRRSLCGPSAVMGPRAWDGVRYACGGPGRTLTPSTLIQLGLDGRGEEGCRS